MDAEDGSSCTEAVLAAFEAADVPLSTGEVATRAGVEESRAADALRRLGARGAVDTRRVDGDVRVWWRPRDGSEGREVSRLADSVPAMLYRCRDAPGWPMEAVSDGSSVVTGYEPDAFTSGDVSFGRDVIHEADRERVRDAVRDGVAANGEFSVQYRVVTASGDTRWVWERGRRANAAGDDRYLEGVITGIDEQKQTERALREERDLTARLLEAAPASIVVLDADGRVSRANEQAAERLGFESVDGEYVVGERDVYDEDGNWLPPEDRPYVEVFESGEPVYGWRGRIELPDVGRRWVSMNAVPLVDEDGDVERVIVTSQDVTRLKNQQRRLERQRDELARELREVFERVDDAFVALDDDWTVAYVNDRAASLLEVEPDRIVGESLESVFPSFADSSVEAALRDALAEQEQSSMETYVSPLDAWLEIRMFPSDTGLSVYFRDVSERKEREQELEKSRRRYKTLVENVPGGAVTLFDEDLVYTVAGGENVERIGLSSSDLVGEYVGDVVPDELAEQLLPHYEAALDGEHREFQATYADWVYDVYAVPVRDEDGEVFAGMGMTQDVTARVERERELERQRERLAALNELHDVVREVTDAVLSQSTRGEVEATACDELASSSSYDVAWLAAVDPLDESVTVRTAAGAGDEWVEPGASLPLDADAGPTSRAVRRGDIAAADDLTAVDGPLGAWAPVDDAAAGVAIPVVHEDTVYGVLGVYTGRDDAFASAERGVLASLGESIGHAIAAVERKRALTADEARELEFALPDVFDALGVRPGTDDGIYIESTVSVDDEEFLVYGTTTPDGFSAVRALVDELDHWREVSVVREAADAVSFEVRLVDPPILTAVASLGGDVGRVSFEDGDYRMRIQVPVGGDVKHVTETVQATYPEMDLVSQRRVDRSTASFRDLEREWVESLTDRQRSVLEAAYFAGYFEWPRDTSGESLAESLDVAPPTFYQHLRVAQKKLLRALLDD